MLYPRQKELLGIIHDALRRTGEVPNGLELAGRMGLKGVSAVYAHLRKLEAAGFVALTSGGRGVPLRIELTAEGERHGRARPWPRLGTIPAGPITDVEAQADDFVATLPDLVPVMRRGDYLLVVDGESMTGAGLLPGMTLVMRPDVDPTEADVCSVYVEGEGNTLKHVVEDGSHVRLVARNPEYPDQRVPKSAVCVQGVLVAALAIETFR
ncbi:S24 family peptidase [Rubrivirga sp. S365]|uniref:LexA family protein n=1 Tax=Rubrivirga sp. S365 TaxID=3076080 RepID=UPI0028C8A38E|nr:S24 family peptidase [Rubrivirga sp. S365]MDT7858401.1 S24 family peptidase [Rubrivirga sp. S365]